MADRTTSEVRRELIAICVNASRVLRAPRSVGEIFGFIFTASRPVTFDEITTGLNISAGTASQGLRLLRTLGAIKVSYVAHDRRDFFVPETSLRRVAGRYLGDSLLYWLHNSGERLQSLQEELKDSAAAGDHPLVERVSLLLHWNEQVHQGTKRALESLR